MKGDYLAFDLGAESGRAILGRLRGGALELQDVARFPNGPVSQPGSLRWDALRLWSEMRNTVDHPPVAELTSIAVDTWGVDYALIGEKGQLLENPYHYRDRRTDGMVEEVCRILGRERIYGTTGIQFMPINTLYQIYAASKASPRLLQAADTIVTIPDLFNYWLTGNLGAEYTNATTTQFMNAGTRTWAVDLFEDLGLPGRLLPQIFEPGSVIGKSGRVPVVAPACHDTGSAVAAIETEGRAAFLSSGTWSLLGTEVRKPVMTPRALELNFTNEGGVCGTTRLLKNIGGLWLLQSCRRCWSDRGHEYSYEGLMQSAAEAEAFGSLIDPDAGAFLNPPDMAEEIAAFCRKTEQKAPSSAGAFTRAILESLAYKYRMVLESLEELIGNPLAEIRIIGGGSKNRLLNQFTANATGRTVIAGPVEATALGNIAMQMVATGGMSLADARDIIARSFPPERFDPQDTGKWDGEYGRFRSYVAGKTAC
ncbi:MAG TPA: rhamnulokinase family protein [Bryobacteraceae bacterium]|nr:rhamnulokinase family protein [Bryobacteraceae bacterium]